MKKNYIIFGIVIVIILAIILFFVGKYNNLVTLEEGVDNKYADIDVQLERRADLIPNLVNTVKGYMQHEDDIIEQVTTFYQYTSGISQTVDLPVLRYAIRGFKYK